MAKTYDYYFDFGSLASYLAYTQLEKIQVETGASPVYLPMLLGAVFKATGNVSPVSVPTKGKYIFVDFNTIYILKKQVIYSSDAAKMNLDAFYRK